MNRNSTSVSTNIELLFEKLDDIGEKTPQQVVQVKDRIQCALKTNPDQFKVR